MAADELQQRLNNEKDGEKTVNLEASYPEEPRGFYRVLQCLLAVCSAVVRVILVVLVVFDEFFGFQPVFEGKFLKSFPKGL